jgi:putative DNA primase/helicase
MIIQETKDAARGKWRGILISLGVGEAHLHKKHGPCPMCGGKDRFRFDNKLGEGTWFCSQCGAGDGFGLAQKVTGKDFMESVREVAKIVGTSDLKVDAIARERSDQDFKDANNKFWRSVVKMERGCIADLYLCARGVGQEAYVADLRWGRAIRDGEGAVRPVIAALVRGPDGVPTTIHRTFLSPDGKTKAEMASPRKMMAGPVVVGACVRLMEWDGVGPLGVAEGIETAFAAANRYKIPVWAALNAQMLSRWQWPDGCKSVMVFGDSDLSFTGQAASFELAKRAKAKGLDVQVHIPGLIFESGFEDTDFADMTPTRTRKSMADQLKEMDT